MSNIIDKIRLSGVTYTLSGQSSGTSAIELTQAQYDALVDKDPNVFYIITDAEAGDLSQYWTSAQTNSAITQAVSGKQDTLVSGTNIKTINNTSILGSGNIDIQGGSTYTAGRGIDITNDTISFSLPISAGTGADSIIEGGVANKASGNQSHAEGFSTKATSQGAHSEGMYTTASNTAVHAEGISTTASGYGSHAEGNNTTADGQYGSHAEGYYTRADGQYGSHAEGYYTRASGGYGSHAEGRSTNATNESEHASGRYNVSNKANGTFGDSGNTLFSVGNGTADNARHNAFEVRQNGDIYLSSGGTDIKLQDHLGGGGSITIDPSLDSGSTNAVANSALYDELRIIEPTETILQWEQSDGGESTNYPSGCTKVMITIDEQQMTDGYYALYNDNYDCFGKFNIESNGGVITVSTRDCEEYEPTTSITYSISGNVVTVEYPTITNVTKIGTSYDNYWTWKAIVNNVTPIIDQVTANTARLSEDEEVTAAALNVLNDKFDGLKLKKLTQSEYNALSPNYDSNTLYVIVN